MSDRLNLFMEREQLQEKWREKWREKEKVKRLNGHGHGGSETKADLTGTFDWARSDLTRNFDWARSDLAGLGQGRANGEDETMAVPDNEKLHCLCQLPEAQGTIPPITSLHTPNSNPSPASIQT